MGQKGSTKFSHIVVYVVINAHANDVPFSAVFRILPELSGQNVRPHQQASGEYALERDEIFLHILNKNVWRSRADVVSAQVDYEDVWFGPVVFQLKQPRQKLFPRHALHALPPDAGAVGVHAQLATELE